MQNKILSKLNPTQFENLTYDLLHASGMRSLVWRTPGADGGRDIEGVFQNMDFSGNYHYQRWYVECKLYANSIDWPTVWNKISYADSRGADYLLLVTNSNPSPNCETEIANWNTKRKNVIVRLWRGYEFDWLLLNFPSVAAKHGLLDKDNITDLSLLPMMVELMKINQSTFSAHHFGNNTVVGLEASAALSELISSRMDQLRSYGKMLRPIPSKDPPFYDWLTWDGPSGTWDEAGIRAFLCVLRHYTGAKEISFKSTDSGGEVCLVEKKSEITQTVQRALVELALWSGIELKSIADNLIIIDSPIN